MCAIISNSHSSWMIRLKQELLRLSRSLDKRVTLSSSLRTSLLLDFWDRINLISYQWLLYKMLQVNIDYFKQCQALPHKAMNNFHTLISIGSMRELRAEISSTLVRFFWNHSILRGFWNQALLKINSAPKF